ncbi:MAG TPA: SRPBCC domain-containing protein [Gemmatales bacterium]|nr:SRPBCC domain-containing protein [Gemmatales bacterium]HMP59014.1 SRPBCC domain-containing protein [Gemmatales bacterium]
MITLKGQKDFAVPAATLWAKLSDMQFLVECVPDKHAVKAVSSDRAEVVIRPSIAFLKGELALTMEKTAETPPTAATLTLNTKGIGTTSTVVAQFQLAEREAGASTLDWSAEVTQLGGLLKAVPKGFIQGAAQKQITELLTSLEAKLLA